MRKSYFSFNFSHLSIGEIVRNIGTLSQMYSTLLLRIYFNGHVQAAIYEAPRTRLIRHTHTHTLSKHGAQSWGKRGSGRARAASRVAVVAVILFNVTHDASCFYLQQPNRATLGSDFACVKDIGWGRGRRQPLAGFPNFPLISFNL